MTKKPKQAQTTGMNGSDEAPDASSGRKLQLSDTVYDYLRQGMMTGRFKPGQTLDQTSICRELKISRAPLRDALIRLEKDGFLEIFPRKGVEIKRISLQEIANIYKILGALEGQCILDIFHLLTQADIDRLKRINDVLYKSLREKAFGTYYDANIEFHNVYLRKWDNPLAIKLTLPLKQRLNDFPVMKYSKECEEQNMSDHERFIHSLEVGNREGAASIIKNEHWSYSVYRKHFNRVYELSENG